MAFVTTSALAAEPHVGGGFRAGGDAIFIDPDSHQNLTGYTSDVTVDADNYCHGSTSDNMFAGGDTAALNVFWDALSTGGIMEFDVTWAVRLPSGQIKALLRDTCSYDVSTVEPGTQLNFCCALFQPVPSVTFSGPWGSRVIYDDTLQAALGTIVVTP